MVSNKNQQSNTNGNYKNYPQKNNQEYYQNQQPYHEVSRIWYKLSAVIEKTRLLEEAQP